MQEEVDSTISKLRETKDKREALSLFREHSRDELCDVLNFASDTFNRSVHGFMDENLRELRKVMSAIEEKKSYLKQVKRVARWALPSWSMILRSIKVCTIIRGMILPARSCSVSVV